MDSSDWKQKYDDEIRRNDELTMAMKDMNKKLVYYERNYHHERRKTSQVKLNLSDFLGEERKVREQK
jgi:hypothetical protein